VGGGEIGKQEGEEGKQEEEEGENGEKEGEEKGEEEEVLPNSMGHSCASHMSQGLWPLQVAGGARLESHICQLESPSPQ